MKTDRGRQVIGMEDGRRALSPGEKGDGNPYYERALGREKEMTPEERAEEEAWWAQVSKKFTVRGKDEQGG